MTGIERLRELAKGMHNHRVTVWQLTDDAYAERFGVTKHGPTIKNFLGDIADQIDREQDKVAQMDWEAVREVAADMAGRTFMSVTIDGLLCDWSRKLTSAADGHDHTNDVSMSAYDLLPQEDRDAIAWVRERGGLDSVRELLDWVVGHCSTRQQLDFDFWLSGRVMHELGFDEDMADRDEVERRLLARLMPEGLSWPVFEDGEPVRIGDRFAEHGGCENVVDSVEVGDCWFKIHGFDGAAPRYSKRASVKRPAPEVLDADGVEIRVGDTVYDVEDGCELVVTKVTSDAVFVAFEDVEADKYDASQLTHERPDSWERLEEDARSIARDIAWNLGNWSPSDFEDVGDDVQARVVDLVRRAKALAGVSE